MTLPAPVAAKAGRLPAVRTPPLRQSEHAECGLAALGILMGYHGVHLDLPTLRARGGDPRLGSTMGDLKRIAQAEGFTVRTRRVEPAQLAGLPLPVLVHLRFIHFAVLEAVGRRGLRLNDPAVGPIRVPWEEFERDFTGITLWLHNAAAPRGRPAALWREAGALLGSAWRGLGGAALLDLGAGAAGAAAAWTGGLVVTSMLEGRPADAASRLAACGGALLLLALLRATAEALATASLRRVTAGAWIGALRAALHAAASALLRPGPVSARLSVAAGHGRSRPLLPILSLPSIAALALTMPIAGGACGTLLAGMLVLEVALALRPPLSRSSATRLADPAPLPGLAPDRDTLAEPGWWKTGGLDADIFGRLAGRHALATDTALRAAAERGHAGLAAGMIGTLRLLLPLGLGLSGHLDPAVATTLMALSALASASLGEIAARLGFAALLPALLRLADRPDQAGAASPRTFGGPAFVAVTGLEWPGQGKAVFRSLSFDLTAGSIVAVTGYGKTSLLRLCTGLETPGRGSVRIDGVPAEAAPPGRAVLVPARPYLPSVSLAEALALGRDILPGAIQDVLEAVELWDAVAPRGGLGMVLSRAGAELSGGQRRRLAIARAMLAEPGLLALDGALDGLEAGLAARVLQRLRARGSTVLLATGRVEIARLADTEIVLAAA